MDVLRTPDERFKDLAEYDYAPCYADTCGLRMHYLDEGPRDAPPILMLHGEPTWSYLYRKMVPMLVGAGHRVVVPDLIGFGRSDKLARREAYTYQLHIDTVKTFIEGLDLAPITLVCQDWGGLIGLRIAAETPNRFGRVVATNTFLPTGDQDLGAAFYKWRTFSQEVPEFPVGRVVQKGTVTELPSEVLAAYEAPFPDESYKAGARAFPMLVPSSPDDPQSSSNRAAWDVLSRWKKPFLTAFSDGDPITRGGDVIFQRVVPGAKGQAHTTVARAGHFVQEDRGEVLARVVADFIAATPLAV